MQAASVQFTAPCSTAAGWLLTQKRASQRRCAAQANALADKLTKAGENFVGGLFFTAGYDPPFRLTGAPCAPSPHERRHIRTNSAVPTLYHTFALLVLISNASCMPEMLDHM